MRLLVTGASGFVGSNIAKACEDIHGDTVISDRVDLLDAGALVDHVEATRPEGIIHCAIINDWDRMIENRHEAWQAYVGATRAYAAAAQARGVPFVVVSTDWVFDGTQGPADEVEPPNPVNFYGFLKAASELIAIEHGGAVARVSGVNGSHWGQRANPRKQDHGFGYFVASIVDALESGRPFTVWEDPSINMVASPTLASMSGEIMRAAVADRETGIFHCCGRETTTRRRLAELTVEVFGLDRALLGFGTPPEAAPMPIPYDTGLDARATSETFGYELPSVVDLLEAFRIERQDGIITPFLH